MRLVLAVAAFALLSATPAEAVQVTLTLRTTTEQYPCEPFGATGCAPTDTYDRQVDMPTVDVTGTPGADDVAVQVDPKGTTVTVTGPGVTAGEGCEQSGAETARCTDPPPATSIRPYVLETRPTLDVALGEGDDRLVLTGGFRSGPVDGGGGADTMTSTTSGISGGPGDDVLTAPSASGGPGNDSLSGNSALDGGSGDDVLRGDPSTATRFTGGPGLDSIFAGSSPGDFIEEASSQEPVVIDLTGAGRNGADLAHGVENAYGSAGSDTIFGTEDDNSLNGRGGNDVIAGGGGNDTIRGEEGSDSIDGGPGGDDVRGGLGVDRLAGGDGRDYLQAGSDVGRDQRAGTGGSVDGGAGDDRVFGVVDPERITGGPGDDKIDGGGGDDRISAGAGDDLVDGQPGRVRVDLGPGDDRLSFTFSERATCGSGTDLVELIGVRFLMPHDCERVDPFLVGPAVPRPRFVRPHRLLVPLNGHCEKTRRCRITVHVKGVGAKTVRTDGHPRTVAFRVPHRTLTIRLRGVDGRGRVDRAGLRIAP